MILETIFIVLTVALIGFGLAIGYGIGREIGRRDAYHRGFAEGVDFARNLRRRQRGRPLYPHLQLVQDGERRG